MTDELQDIPTGDWPEQEQVQQLIDSWKGRNREGPPLRLSATDPGYALEIRNFQPGGGQVLVLNSSGVLLLNITDSAVTLRNLTIQNDLTVNGDLGVSGSVGILGDAAVGGALDVSGVLTALDGLIVELPLHAHSNLFVDGPTLLDSTAVVNGVLTVHNNVTIDNTLTVHGDINVDGNITATGTVHGSNV